MNTNEIIEYYSGLLIKQYAGLDKAVDTIEAFVTGVVMPQTSVQTVTFAGAPASGAFTLVYDGVATVSIAWNAAVGTIQTDLRAITGLGSVTVAGSIAAGLTITFTGVTPPAVVLTAGANTLLDSGGSAVVITIDETDLILPLAIQDGFNLSGDTVAVGTQLDTLGKYAGVTRSGVDLYGNPVTLNDADYLQLIRMAIVTNNAGSSLETIQDFLQQFFAGLIVVTDYQVMRLSYLISSTIGSTGLIQLMITKGLLPKPMGVQLSIAVVPDITVLFAFRTYQFTMGNGKPFNTYAGWNTAWRWLSYANII